MSFSSINGKSYGILHGTKTPNQILMFIVSKITFLDYLCKVGLKEVQ